VCVCVCVCVCVSKRVRATGFGAGAIDPSVRIGLPTDITPAKIAVWSQPIGLNSALYRTHVYYVVWSIINVRLACKHRSHYF
jgi:hypothetical protein